MSEFRSSFLDNYNKTKKVKTKSANALNETKNKEVTTPQKHTDNTDKTIFRETVQQTCQKALLTPLIGRESIPRLPWQLEGLISAATSNQLHLNIRGIPNPNSYVMAWACAYLVGDQHEALNRLKQIHELREKGVN